ncbi:MAG: helix-turn-helix transcriptional regulator [Ruminococcaceae bacterium]|nr:helix-turn-helix transcriptional regulator [Oscillospiraceae bacterium]
MTFGEKLSRLRKECNYTQEQLADVLGVSRQSVSKWELDLAYPETEKLIEMGRLLDCSMDYLLKEEVVEKNGVTSSGFSQRVENIGKRVLTDRNRLKAKKTLKLAGILFAILFLVDILSFGLYFLICGLPH